VYVLLHRTYRSQAKRFTGQICALDRLCKPGKGYQPTYRTAGRHVQMHETDTVRV
jgi:hypothetical protein